MRALLPKLTWFGVIGVSSAIFYAAVVSIAIEWLAWSPMAANGAGFVVATLSSYFGHKVLTFRSTAQHQQAAPRFLLQACLGYAGSAGITYLVHVQGLHYGIGIAIVVGILPIINFVVLQFWVFPAHIPSKNCRQVLKPPI
jgi:putative flippase GtrA